MNRFNHFLLFLFICLIGLISLILNAKGISLIPGQLLFSIILIIGPLLITSIFDKEEDYLSRVQSIILLLIPIIFINYLLTIIEGVPVGYQDVYYHMDTFNHLFNSNGIILFENVPNMSYNFVGLYILTEGIQQLTNLDIYAIAIIIPPLMNIFITIIAYCIIEKIHTPQTAILVAMVFGWESQVLIFGHEYRTQTMGTLLTFSIILIILLSVESYRSPAEKHNNSKYVILLIPLTIAVSTVSFVSSFYLSIILLAISITHYFFRKASFVDDARKEATKFIPGIFLIFTIFLFFYLIYISGGFSNVIGAFIQLFQQMVQSTDPNFTNFGRPVYGVFIDQFTLILRIILIMCLLYYAYTSIREKKLSQLLFLLSFGSLFIFSLVGTTAGMALSPGRIYALTFLLLSLSFISSFIRVRIKISKFNKFPLNGLSTAIFCILIIVIISTSVVKLPNYIIGDTSPIREAEPIDTVVLWDSNEPQYLATSFLSLSNTDIYFESIVYNYRTLELARNHTIYFSIGELKDRDSMFVLEDSFHGNDYISRSSLDDVTKFYELNKIYNNIDYTTFAFYS